MIERFGLSQRKAAILCSVSRTAMGYKPRLDELNTKIICRMKELAEKYRAWGHWRFYIVLRREVFTVNHKRTWRLYRQEGLSLPIRKRKKLAAVVRVPLELPMLPNKAWAMDFVHDRLWTGRRFRALTLVDLCTKECPVIEVDTSLTGERVVRVLERLAYSRGLPESIRVDNGPEFISKALDGWAYRNKVKLDFIRPGKPTENGHVESFNGKFRRECLSQNYFLDMAEAKQTIEDWRVEYNTVRPHSTLNDLTPEEYGKKYELLTTKTNPEPQSLVV
jgi:putative transposase